MAYHVLTRTRQLREPSDDDYANEEKFRWPAENVNMTIAEFPSLHNHYNTFAMAILSEEAFLLDV